MEHRIEDILNSFDGIKKVAPDNKLFAKICDRIYFQKRFSTRQACLIAASFAVLLALNIGTVNLFAKKHDAASVLFYAIDQSNQLY